MSFFEQITQGIGGSAASVTAAQSWYVTPTDGTNVIGVSAHPMIVSLTGTGTVDISDRAARLLGVVYGSQGQQLKQTATNFNLAVEPFVGGTAIDPRSIRALTAADVVSASQSGTWTVRNQDGTGNALTSTTGVLDSNLKLVGGSSLTIGQKLMAASIPVCIASDQNLTVNVGAVYNNQTGTTSSGAVPTGLNGTLSIISGIFTWSTLVLNFVPAGAITFGGTFALEGSTDNTNWTPLTGTLLSANPEQVTQYTTTSFVACSARYNLAGFPYIRIHTTAAFTGTINVAYSLTTALGDETSFSKTQLVDSIGIPVANIQPVQYVNGQQALGTYYQGGAALYTGLAGTAQVQGAFVLPKPSKIGNTMVVAVLSYTDSTTTTTITDTAGNTYTLLNTYTSTHVSGLVTRFYSAPIYAVDASYQIGFSTTAYVSNSIHIVAHEYAGLLTVSPLDVANNNGATYTSSQMTPFSGSITTTVEDVVFALFVAQTIQLSVTPVISTVNIVSNVASVTCSTKPASIPTNSIITFSGLTNATFLNGNYYTVTGYTFSTGIVTFAITHANYSSADTGTFTTRGALGTNGFTNTGVTTGTQRLNVVGSGVTDSFISTIDYTQLSAGSTSTSQAMWNVGGYEGYVMGFKVAATGNLSIGLTTGGVAKAMSVDTSGNLNVNVVSGGGTGGGGGIQYADGVATSSTSSVAAGTVQTGTLFLGVDTTSNTYRSAKIDHTSGALLVDAVTGGISVSNGGTFAVQAAQSGTWTIGGTVAISGTPSVAITGTPTVNATQSGAWTTTPTPVTSGGWSTNIQQALTTSVAIVKASAGQLGGYAIYNPNPVAVYVFFYNAVSPTVGSTTNLVYQIGVPAGSAANVEFVMGLPFSTVIYVACSTAPTSAVAPASNITVTSLYK